MLAAFLGILACFQASAPAAAPAAAPPQSLRPIPFWQVTLEDDFWAPRIRTTIEKTIPACFDQCEKTGRIANWDKAARKEGKFEGYFFNDSDVYKVIEAAAYALKLDPNATYKGRKLDEYVDELIAKIAAMQQPDGYVNSYFVLTGEPKWTDIEHKHELYCAGHLIEAAVAHYECTGKTNLFDIAEKLALHILKQSSDGRITDPCGHPEIELALLRLGQRGPLPHQGEYFRSLAKKFIELHGDKNKRKKLWGEYAQDHKPLKDQTEIVGHAVRAMYLLSAATDLQRLNPEAGYQPALDSLWRDLTQRKMYITGGIGSSASNEGFTSAYDLPNDTAYAETCASIGLVFWAHRMNLLHADGQYFDVLERALYNNVLAAISLDGTQFNYVNPLASRGQHRRQPWHACACCPPNLARLFPTVGGYMYAQSDKAIYVNMYAKSTATFQHGDATVTIKQKTLYPWDGKIDFAVTVDRPVEFALYLRQPERWVQYETKFDSRSSMSWISSGGPFKGYHSIGLRWEGETRFSFEFPMEIKRNHADSHVKSNDGRTTISRGPLVYCFEEVDNKRVRQAYLPKNAKLSTAELDPKLGNVIPIVTVGSIVTSLDERFEAGRQETTFTALNAPLHAVPYFSWNNRDAGSMLVWIPEDWEIVERPPVAWLKPSASHCWQRDTLAALHDRQEPSNSSDGGIPRFTWWPKKGDEQWVQYDFDKPRTVSAVEVYWFDDSKSGGGCKPPATWRLQSRNGDEWLNISRDLVFPIETDRFNRVSFPPIETTGLRIVVTLADGFSAGIMEWAVE